MTKPRILLVDDDVFACQALESMLKAGHFDVVGQAHDGQAAVVAYEALQPDLLLMDIRMPQMTGLEAAKAILQNDPKAQILLLTTFQDQAYISEALALGCKGYLLKQNFAALIPSLKALLAGSLVFDSQILEALSAAPKLSASAALKEGESELLQCLAQGMNNKELAQSLFLSEGTVRNKISALLERLGLRDRTQLVIYYYQGLLEEMGR